MKIDFDKAEKDLAEALMQLIEEKNANILETNHQLEDIRILRAISLKTEKTKEDVEKAMSVTCYKNLLYCCGLEKNCFWQNACRKALGKSDENYVKKEQYIWHFLEKVCGIKGDWIVTFP